MKHIVHSVTTCLAAFFPPSQGGLWRVWLGWLFLLIAVCACSDDPEPAQPEDKTALLPQITWVMSSGRFRIQTGESIQLVPDIENLDETSRYVWTMEGDTIGHDNYYTFTTDSVGEYFIQLTVNNRYGETSDEVKITVLKKENEELPEIPECEGWRFPWTEINMAQGRSVKVKAYWAKSSDGIEYFWTLDGQPVEGMTDEIAYVFTASEQGAHTLVLTQTTEESSVSQQFLLTVCPPAGTHRRASEGEASVNRVYEFMPAPGHQVNGYIIIGDRFPAGCTHEEACDSALALITTGRSVSLGGQGGYMIAGFDHSVPNSGGGYDLAIKGNPYSYQSEPGIIWVSQDDNGDGLPNDQWFELAGSEYGTENETLEYAITYFRPEAAKSPVGWRDCLGETGYIPYMSYWNPSAYYWMDWMEGSEWTYFGSRLRDRSIYENGISTIPPYDWGYADNLSDIDLIGSSYDKMNYFRLSNARTWDGRPANLEYIDFVKIQTAQTGSTPNLGEISTEVYYIGDCHLW